ncbi:tetratricopeptide repeat [Aureococcus anophagefferens]|uniref:Tetratricopeptide repeat n=1 Tax=Aureococcus anophagefferens TaxID=44056 RepID=A0ABR1GCC8_AURAN
MRLPFDAGAPKTLALTIGAAAALERGRLDKSIKFVQAGRARPDSAPLKKQYDGLKSLKRKTEAVDKHLRKGYSVKALDALDEAFGSLDALSHELEGSLLASYRATLQLRACHANSKVKRHEVAFDACDGAVAALDSMVITTREAIVASFDAPSKLSAAGSTELSMRCVNGESPETGSSTGLDSSGYSIGTPLRRQIPRDSDFFVRGDGERLLKGGALELGGAAVFAPPPAARPLAIAAVEWTLDAAAEATLAGAVVKLGFLEQNGERGFYGLAPAAFDDDGASLRRPAIRRYDRGDPNSPRAVVDAHLLDGCVAVAADGDAFRVDFPPAVAETLRLPWRAGRTRRPGRSAAAPSSTATTTSARRCATGARPQAAAPPRRRHRAAARGHRAAPAPPAGLLEIEARESPDPPAAAAAPPAQPEPAAPPPSAASSPYELARFLGRSPPRRGAPGVAASARRRRQRAVRRGTGTPGPVALRPRVRAAAVRAGRRHGGPALAPGRGDALEEAARASLVLGGGATRLVYRNGDARVLGECFLRDLADVVSVDGGGRTGACFDLTFAGGGEPTPLSRGGGRGRDDAWTRRSAARRSGRRADFARRGARGDAAAPATDAAALRASVADLLRRAAASPGDGGLQEAVRAPPRASSLASPGGAARARAAAAGARRGSARGGPGAAGVAAGAAAASAGPRGRAPGRRGRALSRRNAVVPRRGWDLLGARPSVAGGRRGSPEPRRVADRRDGDAAAALATRRFHWIRREPSPAARRARAPERRWRRRPPRPPPLELPLEDVEAASGPAVRDAVAPGRHRSGRRRRRVGRRARARSARRAGEGRRRALARALRSGGAEFRVELRSAAFDDGVYVGPSLRWGGGRECLLDGAGGGGDRRLRPSFSRPRAARPSPRRRRDRVRARERGGLRLRLDLAASVAGVEDARARTTRGPP